MSEAYLHTGRRAVYHRPGGAISFITAPQERYHSSTSPCTPGPSRFRRPIPPPRPVPAGRGSPGRPLPTPWGKGGRRGAQTLPRPPPPPRPPARKPEEGGRRKHHPVAFGVVFPKGAVLRRQPGQAEDRLDPAHQRPACQIDLPALRPRHFPPLDHQPDRRLLHLREGEGGRVLKKTGSRPRQNARTISAARASSTGPAIRPDGAEDPAPVSSPPCRSGAPSAVSAAGRSLPAPPPVPSPRQQRRPDAKDRHPQKPPQPKPPAALSLPSASPLQGSICQDRRRQSKKISDSPLQTGKSMVYFFSTQNLGSATVAQLAEQLTRNEQVVRSNRISSSKKTP